MASILYVISAFLVQITVARVLVHNGFSAYFEASVYCDVCHEGSVLTNNTLPLSNVPATLKCENYRVELNTDRKGSISVDIPEEILTETCTLTLPESVPLYCSNLLNAPRSVPITAVRGENGLSTYTAGRFFYRPRDVTESCRKHRVLASTESLTLGPPDPARP